MSRRRTPPRKRSGVPADATRASWTVAAVLGFFVAALVAMVVFNRYVFIVKGMIVPVLLLAAVVSGRFRGFVNEWALFLGAVVFFDFCRGLVFALTSHFELPMYLGYVIGWERWLCGGTVAPNALQQWRAGLADPRWLDRFLLLIYSSHYVGFLVFGLVIWQLRRHAFRTYTVALMAVMYGGLLIYFLVPTIPPWAAADEFLVLPRIEHIVRSFYNVHLPELLAAFDINPIAAMPSLHAALPAICALLALRYLGRVGLLVVGYALAVCVAVIYLGEHYLVDTLAGWLLALAVYAGVLRWGADPDNGAAVPRASRVPDQWAMRPIAIALVLVAATVGCGQLTARWIGALPITRTFVGRELMGRSPLGHYYLGRIALAEGALPEAQRELTQSLDDLSDPKVQAYIHKLLASLPPQPTGNGYAAARR